MAANILTDAKIRATKVREKAYKLNDGLGLHLFITPTGSRLWRLRFERGGKEQTLSLGNYPDVTLVQAREARDAARRAIRAGENPATVKRAIGSGETFQEVAKEWHKANAGRWSEKHANDVLQSLERDVFPTLGNRPIASLTPPTVLECLRAIEARGAIETTHRIRQRMSDVFVYAIASGTAADDPAGTVKKALIYAPKGHQPAIVDLKKAKAILVSVEAIPGYPVTKLAMRMLAATALRPGAFRLAEWNDFAEIDWENEPTWVIPPARLKLKKSNKADPKREFWVPLPRQAKAILETLHPLTGRSRYLFPNTRNITKPMSENALGYMLNRAGYHGEHVPHGWRSSFSTIMNERYAADKHVIDFMLAHAPPDTTESAYNRALYMPRRRELAQIWADLILDGLPSPDSLLDGRRK